MKTEQTAKLPVLAIVCKRPKLHQGKQRLAATLGAEHALQLAQAFLNCALEDAGSWPGQVVLSPASAEDSEWARALLPEAEICPQPDGNLGERLIRVDRQLRERGYQRILFIGTDAPMLEARHYQAAVQAFERADVVLSAASDGGVTMMGSSCGWPDIGALPWSTDTLGESLKACCEAAGQRVEYILPGYDIDLEEDLRRLADDLQQDSRAARQQLLEILLTLTTEERQLCTIR